MGDSHWRIDHYAYGTRQVAVVSGFVGPYGLTLAADGNLYVADCGFRRCRSTVPADAGPRFRRMPVQWRERWSLSRRSRLRSSVEATA
jgi:sugar lactone lactonase YvrE